MATIITIVSSTAFLVASQTLEGANVAIVALSCPALPGISVGVLIDIFVTGNIHGARRLPSLLVGIPLNWLAYYAVMLGISHFRKDRWPSRLLKN